MNTFFRSFNLLFMPKPMVFNEKIPYFIFVSNGFNAGNFSVLQRLVAQKSFDPLYEPPPLHDQSVRGLCSRKEWTYESKIPSRITSERKRKFMIKATCYPSSRLVYSIVMNVPKLKTGSKWFMLKQDPRVPRLKIDTWVHEFCAFAMSSTEHRV